jgi:hypothetical protein
MKANLKTNEYIDVLNTAASRASCQFRAVDGVRPLWEATQLDLSVSVSCDGGAWFVAGEEVSGRWKLATVGSNVGVALRHAFYRVRAVALASRLNCSIEQSRDNAWWVHRPDNRNIGIEIAFNDGRCYLDESKHPIRNIRVSHLAGVAAHRLAAAAQTHQLEEIEQTQAEQLKQAKAQFIVQLRAEGIRSDELRKIVFSGWEGGLVLLTYTRADDNLKASLRVSTAAAAAAKIRALDLVPA